MVEDQKMANTKFSQLPSLSNPVDSTILPVVDSGASKSVTASILASYVHTKIPTASTTVRGGVKIDNSTITTNGSGQLVATIPSTVATATTFSNILTITGSIKSDATAVGNIIAFNYDNQAAFPSASTYHGAVIHSHADGRMYMAHGSWQAMALLSDITSYSLPTATTSVLGGVKVDGTTITINGSGVISSTGGSGYTLPTATTSVLGGVKIDGSTITINGSGVISSTAYSLPIASTSVLGGVKIDGSTITLNGSNQLVANYTTYTLPATTTYALGGVIVPVVGTSGITNSSGTIGLATASASQLGGVKVDGSTITINGSGVISATGAGAIVYKGTWNASTNTPTLANGAGTTGWQYAVSVGGTVNFGAGAITFGVGDYVSYNGTVWQQIAAGGVAAAGTLTGTTLASNVVTSSLTAVGTLVNLTVTNTITGSVNGSAGTVNSISGNTLTSLQVTNALGFTPGTAYTLPTATTTVLGGVKVDGSTVTINGSGVISASTSYSLPTATTTVLGGVKVDGSTVTINGSGVITANYTTYSLPTATGSVLGGVKVGTGLSIDGSGILSVSSSSVPTYPAITRLDVTSSGSIAYLFNNQYSGNNPTLYAISVTTIAFNLNVAGHPFLIRFSGANYDTGLIHVSTTGVVSTGSSAQGQVSGTLYWQIPQNISGAYGYLCLYHVAMAGTITVKQISSLP